jgi:DNA repair protein SbcD/Mre11
MKILHASNIHLGRSFANQGNLGDRLRAAIKASFSRLIEVALFENVDLVILAGDTFDNIEISQNLLNFFLSEVKRLDKIPLVLLPGARDYFQKESFWEEWEIIPPANNLYLLINQDKPYIEIPRLKATIYGFPTMEESSLNNPALKIKKIGQADYHIAVIYGNLIHDNSSAGHDFPFHIDDLLSGSFDYAALGGKKEFQDFTTINLKAAYPGSLETLSTGQDNSGNVIIVTLTPGECSIEPRRVGSLIWKEAEISMDSVIDSEDLKKTLKGMAGPEVILKVNLKGLALLEAGFNIRQLHNELEKDFLSLEFFDHTRVLPDNISEVKVQEKTILGQYLKVMVEKLNNAEGPLRDDLEESLKMGYTLLTGKEIW